ncbi:Mur ligase middle domain protein [Kribbella flavida DSM 17836]|uniref:Mur ligase middle domain protein n=1 Tax=Kribbella flavida (strain DSM 17836 / JCM 10339 / NBRC 14399) TaxID=479435 RepID=D2PNU9_KRIFD|nr:Mur ligase family protein [Kribbella flavida]ADB32767.1 Mur ligase middle domain protein [Kribbella flavida DSM 17836]
MATSLVELRVLDGANLYFSRAAVKLTLDLTALIDAPAPTAKAYASALGLGATRPGRIGSGFRQRFAIRVAGHVVRRIAREAGIGRIGVRVRPETDVHRLVIAFPWAHEQRARALGQAIVDVIDAFGTDPEQLTALVAAVGERVRTEPAGDPPPTLRPKVPVVAVTGTNGKTTTSRMIAHIGRAAGLHVGWSSTDGVYFDGELVEYGDFSGPSGAGRVLSQPGIQLAVTETARGGILRRGIGVATNDVSVVTNVSADHLGLGGIDTVDQLAEVKAVITKITRPRGWCVVNGDDPRTFAMRLGSPAKSWVFSRDPDSPSIRTVLDEGGRATTVLDGFVTVLDNASDAEPLVKVVDIPMTLSGLSHYNVENALAAASAALGLGLPRAAVIEGLTSFSPNENNPGRMNMYSLRDFTVVIDLAHNEAGLEALLEIMNGVRRPGGRLLLALGSPGDRSDEMVSAMGAIGARGADRVVIGHKDTYLRGRPSAELDAVFREGTSSVGVDDVPSYPTELDAAKALVAEAGPGDVVAVMSLQDRASLDAWLQDEGATVDTPETLKSKVERAQH